MDCTDEFKAAGRRKRIIYHAPLPLKRQRVVAVQAAHKRRGKVKVYTSEEIAEYERRQV